MKRRRKENEPQKIFASIGIDNGVSGSIGILYSDGHSCIKKVPTFSEQDYVKKKRNITRIDFEKLSSMFDSVLDEVGRPSNVKVMLERPMVNPGRFRASVSAIRALETTILALEANGLSYIYIDSKEWQDVLLPKGAKGKQLKDTSLNIASRLFPEAMKDWEAKDADGILIAEYCRRFNKW